MVVGEYESPHINHDFLLYGSRILTELTESLSMLAVISTKKKAPQNNMLDGGNERVIL